MAVDTKTKRLNMLQFARPFVVALPDPDNVIGAANRAHLSQWYLIGGFPSDNPSAGWTASAQSRVWYPQLHSRVWIAGSISRVWHPASRRT